MLIDGCKDYFSIPFQLIICITIFFSLLSRLGKQKELLAVSIELDETIEKNSEDGGHHLCQVSERGMRFEQYWQEQIFSQHVHSFLHISSGFVSTSANPVLALRKFDVARRHKNGRK